MTANRINLIASLRRVKINHLSYSIPVRHHSQEIRLTSHPSFQQQSSKIPHDGIDDRSQTWFLPPTLILRLRNGGSELRTEGDTCEIWEMSSQAITCVGSIHPLTLIQNIDLHTNFASV